MLTRLAPLAFLFGLFAAGCARHDLSPLALAASHGDLAGIEHLIADGTAPDARNDVREWTALMHAAQTGNLAVARVLLAAGADPDAIAGQNTALLIAARRGDVDFVSMLLDHGADLRYRSEEGVDALVAAVAGLQTRGSTATACHDDTVRLLRQRDPELDLPQSLVGLASIGIAREAGCTQTLLALGVTL